jgi:MFS family permease
MKIRIFYGWYMVLAGLFLTTYYSAVFTYGWTSFVTPILATFSWSVTQLSLASTLRGIEAGIFNPLWGIAIDRWSPRKLMAIGVVFASLGVLLISRATNLWMYYAGFLVMGIAAFLATSMVPNASIARWFKKGVGKANGLFYVGMGLGGVLVPLVTFLIDKYGWRETLFYAAIGLLVIGLPLSSVYRRRPEDFGMIPDGKKTESVRRKDKIAAEDPKFTAKQAIQTRAFWYLSIVVFFQSAVLGIMSLYTMPYLENLGINRASASLVITMYTIISVCARMPMGMLADFFSKRYMIAMTLALTGASMLVFWLINGNTAFWLTVLFAVFIGVGISGIMPLRMPILTEYFGRRNIGAIFGIISVASTVGSVSAVPLAGWVFDTYHTYKPVFLTLAIFSIFAVLLMLTIPAAGKVKTVRDKSPVTAE